MQNTAGKLEGLYVTSTENPIVMKPPPMRTGPAKQILSLSAQEDCQILNFKIKIKPTPEHHRHQI